MMVRRRNPSTGVRHRRHVMRLAMATMPRWKQALNHGRGQGNISAQKYHHMPMLGVRSWTCSAAMQGSCLWGLCLVQV